MKVTVNVSEKRILKPKEGEYAPYAMMYIKLLPDDGRVLEYLNENLKKTKDLIDSLPVDKLSYRYAEGKWNIKEILLHIIDVERIFTYRALRFARNDKTALAGFEQDDYTPHSGANGRNLFSIFEEYEAVRRATVTFFNGCEEEALTRSGLANNQNVSVRSLVYQIAGHELHHCNIIKEKYL